MVSQSENRQKTEVVTLEIERMSFCCEGQIVEKRVRAPKGVTSFSLNPIAS